MERGEFSEGRTNFIQALRQLGHTAALWIHRQDLSPNEGMLRASVLMPAESMNIPDYPPIHDDTITSLE
jgi:hypothetical protein